MIKDRSYYYAEFERVLNTKSTNLVNEFRNYSAIHSSREVFLWLEDLKEKGILMPAEIEPLLTNFYWDVL